MSRHRDPVQQAQRALNRAEHFRQVREGRGDWVLCLAALALVVALLVVN